MIKRILLVVSLLVTSAVAGVVYLAWPDHARLDVAAVSGSSPRLTAPRPQAVPTIAVAKAVGWAKGAHPVAPAGLAVTAFASGFDHPRWLYRLPNGDILVAEANAPPRQGQGVVERVMEAVMARGGALTRSADRITLLRDQDGDGKAELRTTFLSGVRSPFGMAVVGDSLYVGATDALLRYPYRSGETRIRARPSVVVKYPGEAHWARNVVAAPDGKALFVTVGSGSNAGEAGPEADRGRALILRVDLATGTASPFAEGLRNPNGMAFEPQTRALWTVVNERDMLGSDLVPDYLTSVRQGDHFGWPWYYWGEHRDVRVQPDNLPVRARARRPDYALGPHVAALGLTFAQDADLGPAFSNGAFIGLHGSWNRRPPAGYKVVFVPFGPDGKPGAGVAAVDVLGGFLDARGQAQGRPAGVITDQAGALLVADDVGNVVWRVSRAGATARPARPEPQPQPQPRP